MNSILQDFSRSRRGAIALMFALTLFPLVALVGLAIDFSFFTEARSQVQLAADAAATQAVRAATGTYALETNEGIASAIAQGDAQTAGNKAGVAWFTAQLGVLPTAHANSLVGCAATGPNCVNTQATTNPSGFTATVGYNGIYPPFFDRLFNTAANWNIAGSSGATAQYTYSEILMLLDTSQSMDIGADPSDMTTMEENSVCMPDNDISDETDFNIMGNYVKDTVGADPALYNVDFTKITNYNNPTNSPTNNGGTCFKNNNDFVNQTNINGSPTQGTLQPCAFACHSTATITNGNYGDLYGMARRDGVHLRIDEVFAATENVLQTMIATQQASQQFSVGVYQFNDDISVLAPGTQGTPGDAAGDVNYEATYNLPAVLQGIDSIDYQKNTAETSFPPVVQTIGSGNHKVAISDYTNFPQSVSDFIAGNATNGTPLHAVNTMGQGNTNINPIKDVFIVTDGMSDTSSIASGGRLLGEMTGVAAETGQAPDAVCNKLKQLGFNVYVLYITYYPLPFFFYNVSDGFPANAFTKADFSLTSAQQQVPQLFAEGVAQAFPGMIATPPNVQAMQACASTINGVPNFYTATDSADINTELSTILRSALSSAIRVSQ